MASGASELNVLGAPAGVLDPEVGRWLAGWTEIRRATNEVLDQIPPMPRSGGSTACCRGGRSTTRSERC